jgi:putative ABC transport system permease protein
MAVWLDGLVRNIRYAIRSLARSPGFTTTVVLTLALGIGGNTAVFSSIDAVLLKPLPFPDADRLVLLRQTQDRSSETNIAPVRLEDWQRLSTTFDAITGYYMEDVSETSGDLPEKVRRAFVAPRFLDTWDVSPAIGRPFTEAEHKAGGPAAVIVSDRYWRSRLARDRNVLNRTVRIGTASFPIVGVMARSFLFPDRGVDLWFPVAVDSRFAQSRLATWYTGLGRLKRGITVEQARANLDAVQAQLANQYPDSDAQLRASIMPLKESTIVGVRGSLWLVFGGTLLLLLITCTNVASLMLARAANRQQEIAVRFALGASQRSIVAQMLIEALLLSLAGASIGLLVAGGAIAFLRSALVGLPRMDEITIDARILVYTLTSAVLVSVYCGTFPALRFARRRIGGELNEGGRAVVSSRHAVQWLLVGAQVSLSVTLLAGAGLLVRSFQELWRVDAGFDLTHVLSFRVSANFAESADYDRLAVRIDRSIEALRALPGVQAVATSAWLPGVPVQFEAAFTLIDAGSDTTRPMVAERRVVSPEYFETMKIPLVQGERCRRQPRGAAADVMVNGEFVRRYLSDRLSPVGLRFAPVETFSPPGVITGVVGNAREAGLDREPVPTVYPCSSASYPTPYFLVRTRSEPEPMAATIRARINELEPLRSAYDMASLEDQIDGAFAQNRLRTTLLVAFAATALSLACVGLYGMLSYVVSLRRKEIGLRLALGAARPGIVRQFLVQAIRVVLLACVGGLALSFASARLLAGMLYGVSASDPATLSTVVALVLVVAILAALVPALRAARLEPMQVLREE